MGITRFSWDWVYIWMMITLPPVLSWDLGWGGNPNLVDLDDYHHQRTEHFKWLVLLAGENIDLKCEVDFAYKPVSEIRMKKFGKLINQDNQTVEDNGEGDFFLSNSLKIENITEKMDGRSLSCEYAQDMSAAHIEAVLHVFKLEIEISEEVCESCHGKVKLVFKGGKYSIDENVDRRLKSKIAELTNLKTSEISVENDEYSVTLPLYTVMNNPAILATAVSNTFEQCKCESALTNWLIGILSVAATAVLVCFGVWKLLKKRQTSKMNSSTTSPVTDSQYCDCIVAIWTSCHNPSDNNPNRSPSNDDDYGISNLLQSTMDS